MQSDRALRHPALGIFVVLLLAACGGGPSASDVANETTETPTTAFAVSGKTDTTVFGPQGTRVFIPQGVFAFPDGAPASGPISIELKELYNNADILLSGTSTMAGGQPLQSAGMVHLRALCDGREVVLRSGASVVVHFPKERGEPPPMRLFYPAPGSSDSAVTDWSTDTSTALVKSVLKLGSYSYRWVTHEDSTAFAFKPQGYVDTGYVFNPIELYVDRFDFTEAARQEIVALGTRAEVGFFVDTAGRVLKPVVETKVSATTRSELIRFLRDLPRFEPGVDRDGKVVERECGLGIMDGGIVPLFRTDSAYASSFDRKYARFENEPIKGMDDAELNYYIFSVSQLGWINCDRFLDMPDRVDLAVEGEEAIDLKLVIADMRGVLKPERVDGRYVFRSVPNKAPATLVAIDRRSGELRVAFQGVTLSEQAVTQLAYERTTLAELRKKLEAL